jgi:uncharacterized protein
MNWRKWNRVLHRDIGFLFFGMTIIYALSGIALNHLADWNPNYIIVHNDVHWELDDSDEITKDSISKFLRDQGEEANYKQHYFPDPQRLKIFLRGGSIDVNLNTGHGRIEKLDRRPLFFQMNFLHYNPKRLWTWFSDLFCVALVLIAVTGLFIIRGKKGITGRGAILTAVGIIIPVIFLLNYL